MADIILTCPTCQTETTLSEYAAPDAATCRSCGARLQMPPRAEPAGGKPRMANHSTPANHNPPPAPRRDPAIVAAYPQRRTRLMGTRASSRIIQVTSWLLFFALSSALAWLRYGSVLRPDDIQTAVTYGILALGILHLYVIVIAFREDVFHGILCLIIPGYSLYYVFLVSDAFFLRAIVASLLVAFGADTVLFLHQLSAEWYKRISDWLSQKDAGY